MLYNRLIKEKYRVMKVEFPNYKSRSSVLVKMYLRGEFGEKPGDVNPYAASTFYAVDRFVSYKTQWQAFYQAGGIIIADRYTTSNMVHQAAKFNDNNEKDRFLDWLFELEFELYQLPRPDEVFFLDLPPVYSKKLMQKRDEKFYRGVNKDIHENDDNYMIKSYNNACYVANRYGWKKINCVSEKECVMKEEDIHEQIYQSILNKL